MSEIYWFQFLNISTLKWNSRIIRSRAQRSDFLVSIKIRFTDFYDYYNVQITNAKKRLIRNISNRIEEMGDLFFMGMRFWQTILYANLIKTLTLGKIASLLLSNWLQIYVYIIAYVFLLLQEHRGKKENDDTR